MHEISDEQLDVFGRPTTQLNPPFDDVSSIFVAPLGGEILGEVEAVPVPKI